MSEEKSFRKAAVGGFHRKDVIDYIEQLLIEQAACRDELAKKDELIAELKSRIAALEAEREAASAVITEEDDPEDVLKKVDQLLKNYLGAEAEE